MAKYISIDIETTGLNEEKCQIIEFGAVFDDLKNPTSLDKLPSFHRYILPKDNMIIGEIFALNMNASIIEKLKNQDSNYQYCTCDWLANEFLAWIKYLVRNDYLDSEKNFNIAGKNYNGFDKLFLNKVPNWDCIRGHRRIIDPAILYWNPMEQEHLPSLDECLKIAGIDKNVNHLAIDDAKLVIELIRKKFL